MKKLLFFFLLIVSPFAKAQDGYIEISGKVTDEFGSSLIGVNITSDSNGTFSNFDGTYKIKVVNDPLTKVTFTSVGFATKSIEIGTQKTIDVIMQENTLKIDEVVVVGYGTQKRSVVTGSVAKIKSEKLEYAPVSRLDQALQGKIAGVRIQNVSSQPGADTKVQVRGISSINAGQGPLVVVDGQPFPDGFAALNNADVESVEVLKDAASAAIYGSRGANGVILITTKSGKKGDTKFTIRSTLGSRQAYDTYDVLSSKEYVEKLYIESNLRTADPLWTSAYGATLPSLDKWRAQYSIEKDIRGGTGTDYQDEALRTALYQDLQFNVSGGTENSKFYISTGYQKDQGLMLKSNFEKLNFRVKYESKLTDKLKVNINLNPSNNKTERPAAGYIDFVRFPSFLPVYHTPATVAYINGADPIRNIQVGDFAEDDDFANLVYSGIDPNGNSYVTGANAIPFTTGNTNPIRGLTQRDDNTNDFRFQGSAGLTYKIVRELEFKTVQNIYFKNSQRLQSGKTNAVRIGTPNFANYTNYNYFDFLTENTLDFKKNIGDHDFSVLAGFTLQSTREKSLITSGNTFPSDNIYNLNFAANTTQPIQSDITIGLISVLGRINYSYKDKYLFMASYRRDGSSLFAKGEKWGGFPAASLGWVVSKENFMENLNVVNRLAFRASYGATGNNSIRPFLYQNTFNAANYVDGDNNVLNGLANTNSLNFNPSITWERTFQSNLGLDLSILNNRLNLSVDVYQSDTEKLLAEQSSLLITGGSSVIANIGSLRNKGIEVELSTVNVRNENFKWTTDINVSHVKNEIKNLGDKTSLLSQTIDGRNGLNTYANVGSPLVSYFGYKTDGIWNTLDDIAASGLTTTITNGLQVGGLKLVDLNGDGVINTDDRTTLGNPYPDYTWGITNVFTYKNLELNFTIQGVQGGQLINGDVNYNETKERVLNYMANRWISPSNPGDGKTPYVTNGLNWLFTDNAIEDASYASLREVSLAYNFSKSALDSMKLTGLRFSLSAQNLYFLNNKNYRGINIEARNSQSDALVDGYQRGAFPIPRTILFGVEVNF